MESQQATSDDALDHGLPPRSAWGHQLGRGTGEHDGMLAIRRVLEREAVSLTRERREAVDLEGLLRHLGIAVCFESSGAQGRLRRVGFDWTIVVNATMTKTRQRFTIAHEIGHYVVEARLGFRPGTSREYWMLEEECQAFAGAILAPKGIVDNAVGSGQTDPGMLLDGVLRLASGADLSIEAAARRVVETADVPVVLGAIQLAHNGYGTAGSSVRWLHSNSPEIKAGRGRTIRSQDPLAAVVATAQELASGFRQSVDVEQGSAMVVERRSGATAIFAGVSEARA